MHSQMNTCVSSIMALRELQEMEKGQQEINAGIKLFPPVSETLNGCQCLTTDYFLKKNVFRVFSLPTIYTGAERVDHGN